MKTVKNNKQDEKSADISTAKMLVNGGSWFYCNKEEYKKLRKRVKTKQTEKNTEVINIENRGLSDKKLRRERKRAKSNKNL